MQWTRFFRARAPELSAALRDPGRHVPCPLAGHQNSRDGFRLFADFSRTGGGVCNTCGAFPTGVRLYAALKGVSIQEAKAVVAEWAKNAPDGAESEELASASAREDTLASRQQRLDAILSAALPAVTGSPVWLYLRNRGEGLEQDIPATLQYLPMQDVWGETRSGQIRLLGRYPAMLARLEAGNAGQLVSVHRTFLSLDGQKAPVPVTKKLAPGLASLTGFAIRLITDRSSPVLHLAEGIETALAVRRIVSGAAPHGSFWAAGNAGLLENMILPAWAKEVHVWADLDTSNRGAQAAKKCVKRWHRQAEVIVHLAPAAADGSGRSQDWLDTLNAQGTVKLQAAYARWLEARTTQIKN